MADTPDRQQKKMFPTNSRVERRWYNFFQKSSALVHVISISVWKKIMQIEQLAIWQLPLHVMDV